MFSEKYQFLLHVCIYNKKRFLFTSMYVKDTYLIDHLSRFGVCLLGGVVILRCALFGRTRSGVDFDHFDCGGSGGGGEGGTLYEQARLG